MTVISIWDNEYKAIVKGLPESKAYLKDANNLRKSIYTKQQQILTKIVSDHELYNPYDGLVVIENVADKIKILNKFKPVAYELFYLIEFYFQTKKACDKYLKSMELLSSLILNDLKQLKSELTETALAISDFRLKNYSPICKKGFELLRALELEVKEITTND